MNLNIEYGGWNIYLFLINKLLNNIFNIKMNHNK